MQLPSLRREDRGAYVPASYHIASYARQDPIAARGLAIAVALGAVMWIAIIGVVWLFV